MTRNERKFRTSNLKTKNHPKLLTGGCEFRLDAEARLGEFWKQYRHFQPDHAIYSAYSLEDRKHIVPICVRGDKGRTLKKSPICCISFETPFGLPKHHHLSAQVQRRKKPERHDGKLGQTCVQRLAESSPTSSLKRYASEDLDLCTVKRRKLNPGNGVGAWQES